MENSEKRRVEVCQNRSCRERGSGTVLAAFQAADLPENTEAIACDCLGQCNMGPSVHVTPDETWYCLVKLSDVPVIVEQHLKGGQPVEAKLHPRLHARYSF
ncbi:(2Fe-2S) ferredoxin domain-containing protein [Oscillatoria sp. FACHB-1406]|uniref:(2Fe-2S) ferredoxin domain-containing protein n=1 Tax=Oscillatoria sp. FACHB-1406 TaxID=2692846 RepID=UPI0016859EA1|nr:(2Fe-2S) ferredoxin domain-containing protein [Oscillatoria sp. FACHB-1406]MBD2577297.1 (2Fe-2S) ferredoxin domain-containing protein [Oscillatoria sp. FACHB-1406]